MFSILLNVEMKYFSHSSKLSVRVAISFDPKFQNVVFTFNMLLLFAFFVAILFLAKKKELYKRGKGGQEKAKSSEK